MNVEYSCLRCCGSRIPDVGLSVENPSCLWGRVTQGPSGDVVTRKQYEKLLAQMNLFYHDNTQDLHKLKPTSLHEGHVCVVYWSVRRMWCRALVEAVIVVPLSYQARCFLVDHGERIIVPSDQIRVAKQNFFQLPFWVRRFHLAGINPTTLRVSVSGETAQLTPCSHWDSSATLYLHKLLQASTRTEVVLLEAESNSTAIQLYLTVGDIKVCVNDELVAKKFAHYSRKSADGGGVLDEVDRSPLMLSSSILTQIVSTPSNEPAAQTPPPPVTSQNMVGVNLPAGQSPPPPQSQEVAVETRSPHSQMKDDLDAAAESDSSEDTDSSLAAALTKNLSLFRFLRFLNPASSYQQVAPSTSELEKLSDCPPEESPGASSGCTEPGVVTSDDSELMPGLLGLSEAEERLDSSHVGYPLAEETSSSRSAESEKACRSEEDWACSRLLEWLNPDPLNPDADSAHDLAVPSDPRKNGVLVHSAVPVEPCASLEDAPITDNLRWVLKRKHFCSLSPAECHSWPAVARGCNTLIISPTADQPLSYLGPLLTHILLNSIFASLTSSSGPIAVLLCPGWEKVQTVYDLLEESKVSHTLHPTIVLLGVGKDEAKDFKIPKNCLLLVTTPFSLVRLLSCHCFLFLRLYHLVLDEADQLFTLAPEQMATILQHFQRVTSGEEKASCPQQLVAVAKRWTSHMEGLLANHMPYPCIIMTAPEEAALYGNVQQIILMTLESSKISVLMGALDVHPGVGQKTLIVTNSAQEVEDVFKAVSNKSAFCLKTHEGLAHQFDYIVQQWRKDIGPGTQVILVTTNECLRCLGIRDATCVVHFGFPSSPKLFGSRLFSMSENFRNLSDRVFTLEPITSCPHVVKSLLLISEKNGRHVTGLLRYLRRTNALLPPELLSFSQGIYVAREERKTSRPLCSYLKCFGVCREDSVCPDRHTLMPQLDQSSLPASGVVEVLPLYIKTASVFHGRIIRKDDGRFEHMASEMVSYYVEKRPAAQELLEGGLYAVQDDSELHFSGRVKVLSVPDRGSKLFFSVLAHFIDVGKEEEVKSHQILQLPERFHSLAGQAVEIIVCRVKPVDAEIDWHPKVTRAVSQKIQGLQHRARAVLSVGNTVFVDTMVRVTQVPGMKTLINEYNVQSLILSTGKGEANQEHLELLRALHQDGVATYGKDGNTAGVEDGGVSLDARIKVQEEVLAEACRAAEVKKLASPDPPHLTVPEPVSPGSLRKTSLIPAPAVSPECLLVSVPDPGSLLDTEAEDEERNPGTEGRLIKAQLSGEGFSGCFSFHPQVHWYQTSDSVTVTVKLVNPESQRCDFHPDRVVYSGRVNGRTFRAQLDLQANITADRCSWEMKSNEPVLKLVKENRGYWEKLVRNKNIFVSYDMEHLEEDEDGAQNGLWFVENTGEEHWYVSSESGSESD
ncbi:putative ATP-dependent RNA helicase TDRD12 [Aulostomus maculatus]